MARDTSEREPQEKRQIVRGKKGDGGPNGKPPNSTVERNQLQTMEEKCEVLLMDRDCWAFIDGTELPLESNASAKERREYQRRKNRAYTTIFLSIEETLRMLIQETQDGKEV